MTKTMLAYYLIATLTACAAMIPNKPPETPEQSVAAATLTLNGIKRTHANLILRLSKESDAALVEQEAKADGLLEAARFALAAGDVAATKTQLEAMQLLLIELNKRIAEMEAKK